MARMPGSPSLSSLPSPSILSRRISHVQSAWWTVLAIVGLDYLSTLGYQPSLAYQAGGRLAPLATIGVVLVTLCAALPVYLYVAGRSPHGGGAAAFLERLVSGWRGKFLILIMLGFTATDFIFTRTVSVAAAAEHLIHNPEPHWQSALERLATTVREYGASLDNAFGGWLAKYGDQQLAVTLVLLLISGILSVLFIRGFSRSVLRLAIAVVGVYLLLNLIVIASGIHHLVENPEVVRDWWNQIMAGHWGAKELGPQSVASISWACLGLFPKLALGLSGFELTMIVMPLIRGRNDDDPRCPRRPHSGYAQTARMCRSYWFCSTAFVIVRDYAADSAAGLRSGRHRAASAHLAYLAHGGPLTTGEIPLNPLFGPVFGTLYDLSAVAILCLAGASVSLGLRDFVPPYLHRLGMELNWSHAIGCTRISLHGDQIDRDDCLSRRSRCSAQRIRHRGAGIDDGRGLCMFPRSASRTQTIVANLRDHRIRVCGRLHCGHCRTAERSQNRSMFCFRRLDYLDDLARISATELRFAGFEFVNDGSRFLWDSLRTMDFPVLVPRRPGDRGLAEKEREIRQHHRLGPDVPIVFVEAGLGDPSGFENSPLLEVNEEDGRFVIRIERCTSIAHVLAIVALELSRESRPPELHFGWSDESPLTANLHFVLFGHGNVPWMVQYLINR